MAEAKGKADWEHTSLLCAIAVNSNPYRKGQLAKPEQFNPYRVRGKGAVLRVKVSELKDLMPKGLKPNVTR